ncbi:MAG: hypothetical protein JNJ45_07485 [Chthonomonas sp.]|nr:hypothetical protein [Chthonomonas sp.]
MKTLIALVSIVTAGLAIAGQQGGACCAGEGKVAKAAKQEACCTSTKAKPVAKMAKGCCNAKGESAKFKVFAGGKYFFFGCAGSADKGRTDLMAKYLDVSAVQVVTSKVRM